MITKAIIENIEPDGFHAKVRIPIYHKIENAPGAVMYDELPTALICFAPGCKPNLNIGDVVYVGFENNQVSEPVIIGMLLNEDYTSSSASIVADTLSASINANLPQNETSFGDINLSTIIDRTALVEAGDLTNAEYDYLLNKLYAIETGIYDDDATLIIWQDLIGKVHMTDEYSDFTVSQDSSGYIQVPDSV